MCSYYHLHPFTLVNLIDYLRSRCRYTVRRYQELKTQSVYAFFI
uniref:Uncharacterized protein n=1 Tax=Siphoviridae sp. ctFn287 TaxID=2826215 RepID=A0A8S5LVB9_9CAUD|nr:MAG TPA: hypothetical protein [Siphoviridae sp. ctFn287]